MSCELRCYFLGGLLIDANIPKHLAKKIQGWNVCFFLQIINLDFNYRNSSGSQVIKLQKLRFMDTYIIYKHKILALATKFAREGL